MSRKEWGKRAGDHHDRGGAGREQGAGHAEASEPDEHDDERERRDARQDDEHVVPGELQLPQ
jgi:hypothetical protein